MINLFSQHITLIPIGLFGLIAVYFLLKYPEVSFALFIAAYVIKGGINVGYSNLTAILLIITASGFILPLAIGKKIKFRFQSSDIWLWVFVITLVGGCFFSSNSQEGFIKAIRFILIVWFPYMVARIFLKTNEQVRLFIKTIFVTAILISILLIIISFSGRYTGGRIEFFEANQIPIATLLAMALVIAVIGTIESIFDDWKYGRSFCAITIIPLLYSLFLVGCRGPLISAISGLIFYFLVTFRKRPKTAFIIGLALFFAMVIWISNFDIIYSAFRKIPNIGSYSLTALKGGTSTIQRKEAYSLAVTLFMQKPLLGIGTGEFPRGYPHNIFLEIAAENGIVGLIVFICFLFAIARIGFRYLTYYFSRLDKNSGVTGLIILTISLSLFIEKQFSYGLDMHKDLFAFLGLVVNLPLITRYDYNKVKRFPKRNKLWITKSSMKNNTERKGL